MTQPLTAEEIEVLSPDQLVNKLWVKRIRGNVIRALVGGLTSTELRTKASLSADARAAIISGLRHPSPPVRWWCLQLIDHLADEGLLELAVPLLSDPVPRIRRHARHALTCVRCKQDASMVIAG